MKHMLFAVLVILALLGLPGCCCMQPVCMPALCHNPYWMEDLQDGYCEFSGAMQAKMCHLKQQARCSFAQLNARFQCPCQQCAQARTQNCPCNQYQSTNGGYATGGYVNGGFTGPGPAYFPASPEPQTNPNFMAPGQSTTNYPPASITPQAPPSVPPVPGPPDSSPAAPSGQNPQTESAPVVVPKITPSASNQPPAIIPAADPSIPLERQSNLNQVGFRKAEAQRAANNGWKPVAALPEALR